MLRNANRNEILGYVRECEQAYNIRVGNELLVNNDITETPDAKPKSLNRKYAKAKAKEHKQQYIKKKRHGYYYRKLQQKDNIDISMSQQRSHKKQNTSQFEGYLEAVQDQEVPTTSNKCCLCKINIEDVNHIISSCLKMSTLYYLHLCHDALAKYILKAIIANKESF